MAGLISYVAAPQANIYFDGILIDECYDIQYSYREAKEPIYGYLSQHFDAVLKGTVLITGALTINYKHDQYLTSVLNKVVNPIDAGISKNMRPQTLKKYQAEYKQALMDYAEELKTQALYEKEFVALNKQKDAIDAKTTQDKVNQDKLVDKNVNDAESAIVLFESHLEDGAKALVRSSWATYSQELKTLEDQRANPSFDPAQLIINQQYLDGTYDFLVGSDSNFKAYYDLKMALRFAIKSQVRNINAPPDVPSTTDIDARIAQLKEYLLAVDLPALRNDIDVIRAQVESLTVSDTLLAGAVPIGDAAANSLSTTRAEDMMRINGFTIEFDYNGAPHKRILNCQLLGHGHVITQSGMPVKEQYTFIAKKLE